MPAARKTDFDVVIVGAGPAGLFAAHHLCEHSELRVLVIDKGKGPLKRRCRVNDYRECFKGHHLGTLTHRTLFTIY